MASLQFPENAAIFYEKHIDNLLHTEVGMAARIGNFIKRVKFTNIIVYTVLILMSYQFLYPLLRMVSMSLMSPDDIINPTVNWLPKSVSFINMRVAADNLLLRRTLVNSLWFSSLLAVCQTAVSSMAGYAFARFNFKFKKFWFMMVLATFIIPTPVVLIPRTMMFTQFQTSTGIQMFGTPYPQIMMSLFGQGIYSAILILIFYNFIRMIPRVLDEAAEIDGANPAQTFFHITLRLSLSTILVVFLFSFVWNWNETYVTSTFLRNRIELLPARLRIFESVFESMGQGSGGFEGGAHFRINEAYRMSATLISILPMLIIYLLVQKQFIKGIENAGITGE
jgi:multiple sugar transport system permease protein